MQQASDVIDVVGNAVAAFDEFGHAPTGPEVGGKAVGLGALEQALTQAVALACGQSAGPTGGGPGAKAGLAAAFVGSAPSADAAGIDLQSPGDVGGGASLLEQVDGPPSS